MMYRKEYENEVKKLKKGIVQMTDLTCAQLEKSMKAIESWDFDIAKEIDKNDDTIDEKFIEYQEKCAVLLAKYQPLSKDLRFIEAVSTILMNLERTADYAVDIANIVSYVKEHDGLDFDLLKQLEEIGIDALKKSIEGFIEEKPQKTAHAYELEQKSDEVYIKLLAILEEHVKKHPEKAPFAFREVLIAKHLERVADRAVNIANRTQYFLTGESKFLR